MAGFVAVGERPQPLVVHERARGRQNQTEKGSADEVDAARPEEVEPLGGREAIWAEIGRGGRDLGSRICYNTQTRPEIELRIHEKPPPTKEVPFWSCLRNDTYIGQHHDNDDMFVCDIDKYCGAQGNMTRAT